MNNEENISEKISLEDRVKHIYDCFSIILVIVMFLQVTVVADYSRSKLCTDATYGVVIKSESNKIGEYTYSYNYVIKVDISNVNKTIRMNNVTEVYKAGDPIYIMYSKKHGIYRTPNLFY